MKLLMLLLRLTVRHLVSRGPH
ncbi:hypothetical protein Godav_023474 [Gossypium davidsonii]|uniref:Uncharacterized protein n=1 Tax=Gossypium davidsonii TaxID=34287 RepID=A0A7J8SRZ0_GOSDV|nr:hypothetical protein [Gossypium davidsonii]